MTAVVRQIRRATTPVAPQPGNLVTELPTRADGELGGDCLCGRGQTIGTCHVTATRLWFRAFHEEPAVYHLQNVTDWACVDCVADAALDVATGVVRDRMQKASEERAEEINALMRTNAMRREAGLPIVPFLQDRDDREGKLVRGMDLTTGLYPIPSNEFVVGQTPPIEGDPMT